jgi:hypothetical protein
MAESVRRFAALYDLHWGSENVGGHKKPLHDPRALDVTLQFLSDFKPHDVYLGGDFLDCGVISHHNKGKARKTEGFRLLRDAEECQKNVIEPLEKLVPGRKIYQIGNHEDWLKDLADEMPGLEGMVEITKLLKLGKWEVVEQGKGIQYGKLYFMHGDTIKGGGEMCAKKGVMDYERNVRFGHFHTYQVYTKVSPVENEVARTGMAIPCLCRKDVGYMERIPNKWVQGFLYGYMTDKGPFGEHIAIIINGQLVTNGKVYRA